MPDTESAGKTKQMNRALAAVVRRSLGRIRTADLDTATRDEIRPATVVNV